jgi:hypothetical protein
MADAEGRRGSGTETVAGKGTGCSAPDEEDGRCHAPNFSRTSRIGRTIRAQGWTVYEIPSTRSVGISIKHRPPFGARLAGAPPHIPMASLASVSILRTSEPRPLASSYRPLRSSAPAPGVCRVVWQPGRRRRSSRAPPLRDRVLGAATRRPAWQAWRAHEAHARRELLFVTPSHETRREMRRAPLVAVQV